MHCTERQKYEYCIEVLQYQVSIPGDAPQNESELFESFSLGS